MADKGDFEIPESLREMTQKSVDQARQAYEQLMAQSRQAQEMMTRSTAAMGAAAKDVQAKALEYTQANMKSGFDLADRLSRAGSVREALEIQSEYARTQIETYSRQAQELGRLLAKAAQPKAD